MVPVTIVDDNPDHLPSEQPTVSPNAVVAQRTATTESSVIEIQIAGAVMRFDGKADLSVVRAVLGMLRP